MKVPSRSSAYFKVGLRPSWSEPHLILLILPCHCLLSPPHLRMICGPCSPPPSLHSTPSGGREGLPRRGIRCMIFNASVYLPPLLCCAPSDVSRAAPDFIAEAGWDPTAVQQSYEWVERRIVFQPRAGPWQRAFRSALLEAGIQPWNGHSFEHVYGTKASQRTLPSCISTQHVFIPGTTTPLSLSAAPRQANAL